MRVREAWLRAGPRVEPPDASGAGSHPRVKPNENVTEREWFCQMIMLPSQGLLLPVDWGDRTRLGRHPVPGLRPRRAGGGVCQGGRRCPCVADEGLWPGAGF